MGKLYIMNGPQHGQSFDLKRGVTHIGRAPDNDIFIKDNSVSRKHLRIFRRKDRLFIEDLRSKNGTLLNGERINPGVGFHVIEGHSITIGKTILCLGEEPSEDKDLTSIPGTGTAEIEIKDVIPSDADRRMTYSKTMKLIHKVSNVLTGSLDINEVFDTIMDCLFDLLKRIDRGAILLIDSKTGKLKKIVARSKYDGRKTTLDYSRSVVDRVIKEGKPVTVSDTSQEEKDDFSVSLEKIRSVMCVPLISRSEIRGVIYVDSLNMPHGFRNEDLLLLSSLSTPVAIAIENALLYSDLDKMIKHRTNDLRETQKRLNESQARFKAIFDNMSSGVVVFEVIGEGEDFVVIDLNRAARKIEKIKKKDALRKSVYEIFPGVHQVYDGIRRPLPKLQQILFDDYLFGNIGITLEIRLQSL